MNTLYFTLQYLSGTNPEKSFADWGLAEPKRTRFDQDRDTFTFIQPGASLDDAPIFDYDSIVVIRRDRTYDAATKLYGDGTVIFAGRVMEPDEEGDDAAENKLYTIASPWIDLE